MKVPSLPYNKIIRALQRDGWIVVRQRGSHIRLQERAVAIWQEGGGWQPKVARDPPRAVAVY